MHLCLVQQDIVWEDRAANFARVETLLAAHPPRPGALIILPEMFDCGFSMNIAKTAQGPGRETERFLGELARRHRCGVMGGVVNRLPDGRGVNESVTVDAQGREICRYRKMQPFSLGGESQHFAAGERAQVFDWPPLKVSPFICYDLRFPELFRGPALQGAGLLVVIASWPQARTEHWVTLLQARAIENQAFVAGVNRCGRDPNFSYDGRSIVVDPQGRILADAGGAESVLHVEIDAPEIERWRQKFPALRDVRPDLMPGAGKG